VCERTGTELSEAKLGAYESVDAIDLIVCPDLIALVSYVVELAKEGESFVEEVFYIQVYICGTIDGANISRSEECIVV
jgi:hypothetical protein